MSTIGHSRRLARIDIQRMLRKHTDWQRGAGSILGVLVYVLTLMIGMLGGGYLALRASESLGPISGSELEILRGLLAIFWLVLTLVYVIRAVGQRGTLAEPDGILTVVSTRAALLGVLLAEYAYALLWLLGPAVGVGTGLAIGTGALWPALAVPAGIAAAVLTSVAVGYPLGVGIRHVVTRFPFVVRNKTTIIVVVFVAYFAALAGGAVDELFIRLFEPMQISPIGWYADLALVGTPGMAVSTVRVGGAVALTVGLAACSVIAGTWIADRHWFSDPALAGEPDPGPRVEATEPGIERRLEPILGTATASLVVLSWRRARRSPLKLLYAFYPVLILAGMFADIVQSGQIPAYLPYAVVLFAAWAAGVIFTLNPLGDQGSVLPATLLSVVDGRQFVRAHLLAGLVVAIPLGTMATAVVAVLSPIDSQTALVLIAGTPVVMVVSAVLSMGIGMAFPRFEATNVTRSMKTVLPSPLAFILFSLYLFVTAVAAAVVYESAVRTITAAIVSWLLPFGLAVSATQLYWIAAVTLVPLVLAPLAAYRYAVHQFDTYTLS